MTCAHLLELATHFGADWSAILDGLVGPHHGWAMWIVLGWGIGLLALAAVRCEFPPFFDARKGEVA